MFFIPLRRLSAPPQTNTLRDAQLSEFSSAVILICLIYFDVYTLRRKFILRKPHFLFFFLFTFHWFFRLNWKSPAAGSTMVCCGINLPVVWWLKLVLVWMRSITSECSEEASATTTAAWNALTIKSRCTASTAAKPSRMDFRLNFLNETDSVFHYFCLFLSFKNRY